MLWSSWSYEKGESAKVAVCKDHHEVITKEEGEKLRYVMIIMKLNEGGSAKVAVCNDHHKVIKKEEVKKLRYVMIIMKL